MKPTYVPTPATGRTITLVESDSIERDRMVEVLQAEGYTVRIVPTLAVAMAQGLWNGSPEKLIVTHPIGRAN